MSSRIRRIVFLITSFALFLPLVVRADDGVNFETETLSNGLQVIYAPMPTSPVTHVRVLYHVGSRDERPDRQGFAHMFEHMMFRGSEHVKSEEHMKLIGHVGGISNAFTSFDQTVYVNTVPNNYTQLALWLEADRMSSFKVSGEIFDRERKVVSEEWRLRQNQPYGTMWEQLHATVFKKHNYRWTPIGNMDHLAAAAPSELQAFFNTYYVPNNAILVVAGGIDVAQTKKLVQQYYGWIPRGEAIKRVSPKEPEQTEPRRVALTMKVPLPRLVVSYPLPGIGSPDEDAVHLMSAILGDGQSSRLYRALVTSESPLCQSIDAMAFNLEDAGFLGAMATVLPGKEAGAVEKIIHEQIAAICNAPVTPEELEKAKQQVRVYLAKRWETAEKVATELGDELQSRGNFDHMKNARQRLEAVTVADVQRVAKKYFVDSKLTTLVINPGTPTAEEKANSPAASTSQPATQPVKAEEPRAVNFPADYPSTPPMTGKLPAATFEKGTEKTIAGVQVIVMEDHRVPAINWSLTFRQGGHSEAAGKEGLAAITAQMVRRGPKGVTFDKFNEDLESRGIELDVSDGGDNTQIGGSCLKEQFGFGMNATRDILTNPAFDSAEFAKLQAQAMGALKLSLNDPRNVASRQLSQLLYGDSALGRQRTPASLKSITLEDARKFFDATYRTTDAVLMISGDITVADGQAAAEKLLAGLKPTETPAKADYTFPATPEKLRIVLIDRPESKQSNIRMGIRAYDITSDDKFPGSLSGQMLSSGIDSRLGKYVRAEKGYVYGVGAYFLPGRQGGAFSGSTDTRCETTADTIEAMFKVFNDMKAESVGNQELADAKFRVAGQLLMSTQTVEQQAAQRVTGILNHYPVDYYDKYAERIAQVSADEIKSVMNKYVLNDRMTVVVVAPASQVKEQLEKLGAVEVLPMPASE